MLIVCPSCGRHAFQNETSCPHCGQKGRPTLLALAATLGFVAACASNTTGPTPDDPIIAVYGPPPIDPSARTEPAPEPTTTPSTTPTAQPPVDVYGPPPRDPNQRK